MKKRKKKKHVDQFVGKVVTWNDLASRPHQGTVLGQQLILNVEMNNRCIAIDALQVKVVG